MVTRLINKTYSSVPTIEGAFHRFVSTIVFSWAVGAAGFQWLASRTRRSGVPFGWTAFDVLMLSLLIYRGDGPRSALILAYLLLIAGTALRFRISLAVSSRGCAC